MVLHNLFHFFFFFLFQYIRLKFLNSVVGCEMVFFFLNLCIYLERQNEAHMSRINKCDLLHLLDEDQLIHSYLLTGFPLRIHLLPLGGYFGELGANICLSDKKCIGSESWRVE